MEAVRKLVGRNDERKTRLHSRRGDLVFTGLGSALRRRDVAGQPWMVPGAITRLNELLRPEATLLELGSGVSTVWYAERCAKVTSIEPNAQWVASTRAQVAGRTNVELVESTITEFLTRGIGEYTVAIVDHHYEPGMTRPEALALVRDHVRIAVLDDSDRPSYRDAEEIMRGWNRERFAGMRRSPMQVTETTIWTRPS